MNASELYLLTSSEDKPLPPQPSRDEICGVNVQFQGRIVVVDGVTYPYFPTMLQCLNQNQRAQLYSQLKTDTHLFVEFLPAESIYNEPGQPFYHFISPDFEANPGLLLDLIVEIIDNGYIPGVIFNGDNGDNPVDGYPNALRQLPILFNLLLNTNYGNLNKRVLYLRFWDGVFEGSLPVNIKNFGVQFRKLMPGALDGFLGIEFQPGAIPVGNGEVDYDVDGMMSDYDVLFAEYADGYYDENTGEWIDNTPTTGNNTMWQINGRLRATKQPYIRPSDQPADDDPNPPSYFKNGNARGPYFFVGFEYNTLYGAYAWVRVDINNFRPLQFAINARRNYTRSMGVQYTG